MVDRHALADHDDSLLDVLVGKAAVDKLVGELLLGRRQGGVLGNITDDWLLWWLRLTGISGGIWLWLLDNVLVKVAGGTAVIVAIIIRVDIRRLWLLWQVSHGGLVDVSALGVGSLSDVQRRISGGLSDVVAEFGGGNGRVLLGGGLAALRQAHQAENVLLGRGR